MTIRTEQKLVVFFFFIDICHLGQNPRSVQTGFLFVFRWEGHNLSGICVYRRPKMTGWPPISAWMKTHTRSQKVYGNLISGNWEEVIKNTVFSFMTLRPLNSFRYRVICRSQWQSGLRRGSTAASLLGLRVRIPLGARSLSVVIVVCCQVEVSATGWSLVQRSATDCGVCHCVWSRNLKNEAALTRVGLLCQKQTQSCSS